MDIVNVKSALGKLDSWIYCLLVVDKLKKRHSLMAMPLFLRPLFV